MKLSAEQFEQIVARLRSDGTCNRLHDKRTAPRVGLRMQVGVIPCTPGRPPVPRAVWIRDLSQDGIGLLDTEPIERGTYFLAAFRRGSGETLTAVYQVAYCVRVCERQYTVGAKLERILDVNALGPRSDENVA